MEVESSFVKYPLAPVTRMPKLDPDIRRTWLFGPGADDAMHRAMLASGADALIVDLEDFTPPRTVEKWRSLRNDSLRVLWRA